MDKKIVELDVDGVIGDLYSPIEKIIRTEFPDKNFRFEKDVKSFGMKGVDPKIKKRIFELFKDPEIIKNEPLYSGCKTFLKKLYAISKKNNFDIVIHTHMLDKYVAEARKTWLESLITSLRLDGVKVVIDCGKEKNMFKGTYYVVEDCIENLKKSDAQIKILLDRPHNNEKTNAGLLDGLICYRCNSYSDILDILSETD